MAQYKEYSSEHRAVSEERKIRQWRAVLENNPEMAEKAMRRAMGILMSSNKWSSYDLTRFWYEMKNGVSHPSDFGVDDNGVIRVA